MLWYNKPIFTLSQVKRLKERKYAADDESILNDYLQPWWNFCVTLLPLWMAPNLVTLLGLVINVVTTTALLIVCPTATEELKGWIPFWAGVGLFLYQTLDAIDGKQARRTGSSNALGELFDHGCDCFSSVMLVISTICMMGLGHLASVWMLYFYSTIYLLFYLAHWQTYVTGRMRFGKIDVTETQIAGVLTLFATAAFGSSIWGSNIFGLVSLRYIFMSLVTIFSVMSFPTTINRILFGGAGKNGSTVAGTSVIAPIIPLFLVLFFSNFLAINSQEKVFESNPVLYLSTFGLIGSKVTIKLMIAQMTKSEMDNLDLVFACPLVMFINQSKGPFIAESQLLISVFVFVVVDYFAYVARCLYDIVHTTGWYLFKIRSPADSSGAPSTQSSSTTSSRSFKTTGSPRDRSNGNRSRL